MKIFDSHCHLDDSCYKNDFDEVIKNANKNNVVRFMTVGTDKYSSSKAVKLAEKTDGCFAALGVHPHFAKDCSESIIEYFKELAKNEKVKAIGEIGLDFNRMFSPKEDQEKWFVKQLEAAKELNLPVIFHERDSKRRFYEILKANFKTSLKDGQKGVVHCFSGDKYELEKYLKMGLYIGITGIVTIKQRGAKLRELIHFIPENRILIETDAPYLTPAPQKNKTRRNEPAFVKSVLLKIAEVKKEDPEKLSEIIWENTCRLFEIDKIGA
jgi:TatD DNase family protein